MNPERRRWSIISLKGVVLEKLRQGAADIASLLRPSGSGDSRRPTLEEQINASRHHGQAKEQTVATIRERAYQEIEEFFNELRNRGMIQDDSGDTSRPLVYLTGEDGEGEYYGREGIGAVNDTGLGKFDLDIARQGPDYYLRIGRMVGTGKNYETGKVSVFQDIFRIRPGSLEYEKRTISGGKPYDEHYRVRGNRGGNVDEYAAGYIYDRLSGCIQQARHALNLPVPSHRGEK